MERGEEGEEEEEVVVVVVEEEEEEHLEVMALGAGQAQQTE